MSIQGGNVRITKKEAYALRGEKIEIIKASSLRVPYLNFVLACFKLDLV